MILRFKKWLSNLILRGRVLQWWLRRKMKKLERQYFQTIDENAKRGPLPETWPKFPSRPPVKTLLYISDDQWEITELVPELRKICAVEVLNLHPSFVKRPESQPHWEVTLKGITEFIRSKPSFEPDVIFPYLCSPMLSEAVFEVLRKRWSCPLIGMNLDDKIEFFDYNLFSYRRDNYHKWAKYFDVNITNGRLAVDWYLDRGLPVYYMPQGCFQKIPPPPDRPNFKYDITFLGRWRPEREMIVRQMQEFGVPVRPIGGGWPGSAVVDVPEWIFQGSQINFGIGFATPSEKLTTTKGRDFECPSAGACYLTTYHWELGTHYDIGKEILCYRSLEEAAEIYSYYHRRPEECLKMAHAAYRRCQAHHTWEKRFRTLFQKMGFS